MKRLRFKCKQMISEQTFEMTAEPLGIMYTCLSLDHECFQMASHTELHPLTYQLEAMLKSVKKMKFKHQKQDNKKS